MLTGASDAIVVRIFGPDLDVLRSKARRSSSALDGRSTGVADLQGRAAGRWCRRSRSASTCRGRAALGLTPGDVRRAATTLVQGDKVGEVYREQQGLRRRRLGHAGDAQRRLSSIRDLPIDTPSGGAGAAGRRGRRRDRADPERDPARGRLAPHRRHVQRQGPRPGRASPATSRPRVAERRLPAELPPRVPGRVRRARGSPAAGCWLSAALSLVGILLLLHVDFGSWRLAALVVLTLPFALVGGVLAALLAGGVLSLGSLVGFVTVLGIAARNGIMLGQPLPPPGERGGRAVRPRAGAARRARSGWRRS